MVTLDADLISLGVAVARLRRGLALTIDELADSAGVHRKTIIQIEAGRVSPRIVTLGRIANALDVPLADLLQNRPDSKDALARSATPTFHALWQAAVMAHGPRRFLVFRDEDDETAEWTYAAFDDAVRRIAGALAAAGVRPDSAVHVALENSPVVVALWLAAARLGAWIVLGDPHSEPHELSAQIRRTGASVGIYAESRADAYEAAIDGLDFQAIPVTETAADIAVGAPLASYGSSPRVERTKPNQRLTLVFSSALSAEARGIELTQANYVSSAFAMSDVVWLESQHRWLVTEPLFRGHPLASCIAPAIAVGASVVLTRRLSAWEWVSQATEFAATHACLSATSIRLILAKSTAPAERVRLQHVWFTGKLGPNHYAEFTRLVGVQPRVIHGSLESVVPMAADLSQKPRQSVVAVPVPGREVAVLNPRTRQPMGVEAEGLFAVQGTAGVDLFTGYLNEPHATAERFVIINGQQWLLTGDVGRIGRDGTLHVAGRVNEVIHVGRDRVNVVEVAAIIAQAPGVLEVVVVGRSHPTLQQVPVAFVAPANRAGRLDRVFLTRWAEEHLAPAARPRAWHRITDMPRRRADTLKSAKTPASRGLDASIGRG